MHARLPPVQRPSILTPPETNCQAAGTTCRNMRPGSYAKRMLLCTLLSLSLFSDSNSETRPTRPPCRSAHPHHSPGPTPPRATAALLLPTFSAPLHNPQSPACRFLTGTPVISLTRCLLQAAACTNAGQPWCVRHPQSSAFLVSPKASRSHVTTGSQPAAPAATRCSTHPRRHPRAPCGPRSR